jgi:restriction endonuclease S subunit
MRDVPSGWRRVALREITEEQTERVGGRRQITVLSSTKHHGLVPSDEYFKGRTIYSNDLTGYKIVQRDWFAYATNHLAEGSIGLQGAFNLACVSPIYTVFSCAEGVYPPYMFRLLKSPELVAAYGVHEQASVDRRGAVRYHDFGKIEVNLPPEQEQRRIAEILDTLDSRISSLDVMANKQLKILGGLTNDLLAEDAAMADPARLGDSLIDIEAGWSPLCEDAPPPLGKWGVLKVSAVTSGTYIPSESKTLLPGTRQRPELQVRPGDLILCRANGVKSLVGVTALVRDTPPKLMLSDKLMRLIADKSVIENAYLELVLASADVRRQIDAATSGSSGQNNISQGLVRALRVHLPSLSRQRQVVAYTEAGRNVVHALKAERSKLLTLKQGLMEDLLTGRVRVSEAEAVLEDL